MALVSSAESAEDHPPATAWGNENLWDNEYSAARAIPSSHRVTPSRSFRRLVQSLGDLAGAKVLDVGAGTGRHAIFAARSGAEVHAVDVSEVACDRLRRSAAHEWCGARVHIERASIGEDGVPEGPYDLIIDSYATCHLLTESERIGVLEDLSKSLRKGGRLYTSGMGLLDSFYSARMVGRGSEPVSVDPVNGIAKRLQGEADLALAAYVVGDLVAATTEHFRDRVGRQLEDREVLAAVYSR